MNANRFDIWFVAKNQVFREVPFEVVAEWVQEARVLPTDKLKSSGTEVWTPLSDHAQLSMYFVPANVADHESSVGEPDVALDFAWRRNTEDEDDDVDMIPLIDISLVLLIFFMMTATVAAISKIQVPEMENAGKLDANPEVIRLDLDWVDKRVVYGIGVGNTAPAAEDGNLNNAGIMLKKMDAMLAARTSPAKVRIAAHAEVPYERVDDILSEIQKRIEEGVRIGTFTVQVGERK